MDRSALKALGRKVLGYDRWIKQARQAYPKLEFDRGSCYDYPAN
jgi:hypothetical protein